MLTSIKKICDEIRSLGLTCRYQPEYQEFRIDYKKTDRRWTEDTAYYTTYRDDALETAKHMASQ